MPGIPEYISNVAPIASAGGVMSPYKEAPPMTPINAESEKYMAIRQLGKEVGNVGEDLLRVKAYEDNHNEEIIAHKTVNDFDLDTLGELNLLKQNNRGKDAMLPEFLDEAKDLFDTKIQETMEGVKLSPVNTEAVKVSLDKIKFKGLHDIIQYQENQRHEVENDIILTDYMRAEQAIKDGADPQKIIASHMAMVEMTQPGNTERAKLNAQRLSVYAVEASKRSKETDIILGLTDKHKDNVEEMLKEVESSEFLKKYGIEIQHDVRADITAREVIKERQYKQFAEQKVGAAAVKIYNNQRITFDDTAGLRPAELADIEKIKDYQFRQNRSELRITKQENKIEKIEKSNTIAGEIQAKILNGEEVDRLEIYKRVPLGLDINEANKLVLMADKISGDPKYKDGIAIIKTAFKNGVLEADDYKTTMDKFKSQVDAEGGAANVVKIANDLVNPKKQNAVKEWLNNVFSYMGETADININRIKGNNQGNKQAKTVTIDGKRYKDGDVIKKDGKSYRVTVK